MSREKWLNARQQGIGASEAGCCVLDADGVPISPYGSPYTVWLSKLGFGDEKPDNEFMEAGRELEGAIRDWSSRKFGYQIYSAHGAKPPQNKVLYRDQEYVILRSPERPHVLLSPDGWCLNDSGDMGYAEIKMAAGWNFDEWHERALLRDPRCGADAVWPPPHYIAQCQQAMYVSGLDYAVLFVLFGGFKLRHAYVPRDNAAIASIVEAESELWSCVQQVREPEIDASDLTKTALARYPVQRKTADPVVLPADAVRWDEEITKTKAAISRMELHVRLHENYLRAAIGDAEVGLLHDGSRYTFKADRRGRRSLKRAGATAKIVSKEHAEEIATAIPDTKAS